MPWETMTSVIALQQCELWVSCLKQTQPGESQKWRLKLQWSQHDYEKPTLGGGVSLGKQVEYFLKEMSFN